MGHMYDTTNQLYSQESNIELSDAIDNSVLPDSRQSCFGNNQKPLAEEPKRSIDGRNKMH